MKKSIILLLCVVFIFASVTGCSKSSTESTESAPADASAEEIAPVSDFEYVDTEGGIQITKYKGSGKNIVIPSIIENKKVSSLAAEAFSGNVVVQSVTLPEYFADVFDLSVFKNCDSLSTVCFKAHVDRVTYKSTNDLATLKKLTKIKFTSISMQALDKLPTLCAYLPALNQFEIDDISDFSSFTQKDIGNRRYSEEDYAAIKKNNGKKINFTLSEGVLEKIKSLTAEKYFTWYNYYGDETFSEENKSPAFRVVNEAAYNLKEHAISDTLMSNIIRYLDAVGFKDAKIKFFGHSEADYFDYSLLKGTANINGKVYTVQENQYFGNDIASLERMNMYEFVPTEIIVPLTDNAAKICIFFGFENLNVNETEYSFSLQ